MFNSNHNFSIYANKLLLAQCLSHNLQQQQSLLLPQNHPRGSFNSFEEFFHGNVSTKTSRKRVESHLTLVAPTTTLPPNTYTPLCQDHSTMCTPSCQDLSTMRTPFPQLHRAKIFSCQERIIEACVEGLS